MPASFDFEDGDEVGRINQGFVFRPLRRVETTLVGALSQRVDPLLHWLIDSEGNETASRFGIKAKAQGFQNTIKPRGRIHVLTLPQGRRGTGIRICANGAAWRKLVGVEPTRDTKCRTTGFEDQAQHRPRLASSRDSSTCPRHPLANPHVTVRLCFWIPDRKSFRSTRSRSGCKIAPRDGYPAILIPSSLNMFAGCGRPASRAACWWWKSRIPRALSCPSAPEPNWWLRCRWWITSF